MSGAEAEPERLLARRREAAEAMLRDALRVDVARFVSTEIEARLLARPHFRGRFPPQALATLRADLDRAPPELVDAAWERVRDLRVWFGAKPAEEAYMPSATTTVTNAVPKTTSRPEPHRTRE